MKADILLNKLIDKIQIEGKSEYRDAVSQIKFDLPDEFEKIVNGIDSLLDENAAKQHKAIGEHYNTKLVQNYTQAMVGDMKGFGFTESEIDDILKLPFEKRATAIAQQKIEMELKKMQLTESERVRAAEEQARREKERADMLQARGMEELARLQRKFNEETNESLLKQLIARQQIDAKIPVDRANRLILQEVKQKLELAGAEIVDTGTSVRVVKKEDPTLDYYDERHNRVTIESIIDSCIKELNLAPAVRQGAEKKIIINSNKSVNVNSTQNYLRNLANSILS